MITYLLDTSARWHLFRTPGGLRPWEGHITAGVFHICEPTRTEFPCSATSPARRDGLAEELDGLCLLSPVPKRSTSSPNEHSTAQHRAAGANGLLLDVDNDFAAAGTVLKEVQQRDVRV
ncbi:VapC toxin family PIN domain ribonuclease [Streptomyces sp. Tue 6075]|uniref:VapC toxin family PIN domain ribonuclease n=1 Tax=Streptomyces sp. Tue 6075 TaxID=1661694 RepID=UPI00094B58DC